LSYSYIRVEIEQLKTTLAFQRHTPSLPTPQSPRMDIAEQLLDLASKAGAEAAEVYQANSLSRPVFFEANRLKQLETAQSEGIALRLWKDGRPGLAVAYGAVEPKILVAKSIELSQLNDRETPELNQANPNVYPNLGQTMPIAELVTMGKGAIELVRSEFPDAICSSQWDCDIETTRLVNSLGLDCSYTDTTLSGYLAVEWIRGDDFLSVGDGQTQRGDLDPAKIAQSVIKRLQWAKKNIKSPTGKVPILFTSKAADLLWETVQAAMNGKRAIEGASPWSDRLGEQVVSPLLTISQEPDCGPFSCPFDDEGSPTRNLKLIQSGKLKLFYADRTIGRQLGSGSTGNGFRSGLGSYPTPDLVNLTVAPGNMTFAELVKHLDSGIIVDQILGSDAGMSGDFSINVELGYRVRKGEIVGRIKDTMVSGNVYNALKQVVAIGSDVDWNGPCHTPSIIVEGLSVTGRG
jgi:PmbA protein